MMADNLQAAVDAVTVEMDSNHNYQQHQQPHHQYHQHGGPHHHPHVHHHHYVDSSGRRHDSLNIDKDAALVFKDVCVTLGKNDILKTVYGMAKVGQMLAVMGPSGAGKSTLLNTLTGRIHVTSGSVTLNGFPVTRQLRRKISYVMQQDVFYWNLTLKETLTFQTLLRLPGSMPHEMKMARMQEIVNVLELNKCLNTRMGGTFVTGLSGGERKRASIACELLTNPKLLILDEPTSGLDSAIACSLMSALDSYAKLSSKTVVTTIHQPSSQIFHMFTNILLLNDGEVAYFGPRAKIVDFFAKCGMYCEPHYNPADFILEKVKSGPENSQKLVQAALQRRYSDDWPAELRDSDDSTNQIEVYSFRQPITVDKATNYNNNEVKVVGVENGVHLDQSHKARQRKASLHEVNVEDYVDPEATFQTGFRIQYTTLTKRNFLHQKHRYLSKLHFGQVFFIALLAGVVWFRTERSEETAKDRLGILFFHAVQFGFIPALDAITALNDDAGVFIRERGAGQYRLSAYYLAVMTTEIPMTFVLATMYVLVNYWMVNLTSGALNFISHWLIIVLSAFSAQSIGMLISVAITSRVYVMSFSSTFIIGCLLAGGFYNTHLAAWFKWLRYLSFITYTLNALAKVEFTHGDPLSCNPNNTIYDAYCTVNNTLIDGEHFLETWDLNFTPLYADLLAHLVIIVFCRIAAYYVLRYLRRPKL